MNHASEFSVSNELISKLSHFGLNPHEWNLIPTSENVFHIENKQEPDFYLEGVAGENAGRATWVEISLMSL